MPTFIDDLLQDPSFLTGASLLGGQTRNIGANILGAQQAIGQIQAAKQLQAQRELALQMAQKRQQFNPADYVQDGSLNRLGLLSGAMQSGFEPADVASIVATLQRPTAKYMNLSPGGTVFNETTGEVEYQAPFKPPELPSAVREVDVLTQRLQQNPNDPVARDLLGKVTGADAKAAAADRAAALQAQREATNELRKQGQEQQNQRAQDARLMKFSAELEKAGIPQQEQVLGNIEARLAKYQKGDIPGFTKRENTAANMGLTWMLNPEAQEMRQAVQPLANLVIKDRSGAAVTTPEWERFKTELGAGSLMSSDRLRQGLKMFRELQDSAKRNFAAGVDDDTLSTYMDRNPGIKLPGRRRTAAPAGGAPTVSREDAMSELRRRGLVK